MCVWLCPEMEQFSTPIHYIEPPVWRLSFFSRTPFLVRSGQSWAADPAFGKGGIRVFFQDRIRILSNICCNLFFIISNFYWPKLKSSKNIFAILTFLHIFSNTYCASSDLGLERVFFGRGKGGWSGRAQSGSVTPRVRDAHILMSEGLFSRIDSPLWLGYSSSQTFFIMKTNIF